jgi:hypothetical protein
MIVLLNREGFTQNLTIYKLNFMNAEHQTARVKGKVLSRENAPREARLLKPRRIFVREKLRDEGETSTSDEELDNIISVGLNRLNIAVKKFEEAYERIQTLSHPKYIPVSNSSLHPYTSTLTL